MCMALTMYNAEVNRQVDVKNPQDPPSAYGHQISSIAKGTRQVVLSWTPRRLSCQGPAPSGPQDNLPNSSMQLQSIPALSQGSENVPGLEMCNPYSHYYYNL
jgi:hypothetical protein